MSIHENKLAIKYKPTPGQLCHTFKGKDNVYFLNQSPESLISYPLIANEIVLITKVEYYKELSSYYVEFMRDKQLFYTYFYEQVFCFDQDQEDNELIKLEEPNVTFDFPWVLCE
tara:strand:- start:128 stop:469 length:342 start_codon:yes stop_codon:yes gene_type:complete